MGTAIENGSLLGRYRIVSPLGAGGMGEVYLARDEQLERHVAVKVLSTEFTQNADRLRRFEQEARAAAKLSHPAIAHVYEVGEAAGVHFIAMEYVEGETLNAAIHRQRVELPRLLKYLGEVADGLAKAHAAGVVHRDLKPDNVMIARDGYAKILDFGLAKLVEPEKNFGTGGDASSEAATAVLEQHSTPGVVMGTVGYMSPEQAQGKVREIDHRTDIFSFGCLLYEAATGHRPFEGDSLIRSLHKLVYESAPPITDFNPEAPAELQRIVRRCLAKDADERYQSIKDVAIELRELRRELEDGATSERGVASESSRQTVAIDQPAPSSGERAAETFETGGGAGTTANAGRQTGVVGAHMGARVAIMLVLVLVAVASAVFGIYLYHARGAEPIDSVAVLPLANATNDPTADWLADGLTESVIYKLSQVPDLKVIARSTVFRYKGRDVDAAQAAKELGVRAILTGRVAQRGDSLTVSAELIDTREGKLLWGERYERKMADVNAVQQEIAREVSDHLRPKMTGAERGQLAKSNTANTEAYQLYLKGRYYWNKRTADDLKKSIDFFQQAVALDPNYALAYAGLADAYQTLPSYSDLPPEETYLKSKTAAQKAIELDPALAEPHAALGGDLSEYDRDFAGAEREFKRAIELNPNYATGHQWYGEFLAMMGRFDEAIAEAKRAQQLDPQSPIINTMVGETYREERSYDEAVAQLRRTLEIDPNFAQAHSLLGAAYEEQGKYEEMIEELRKAAILFGAPPDKVEKHVAANLAAYRSGGKRGYWQSELELTQKEAQAKGNEPSSVYLAMIYAQLGDKDRAFAELEKAYRKHPRLLNYLKVDSIWDPLRSDPRFADMMRRIGLPQ
jgi:TolB-like protein/Tfp pilus assembly protein PilF/tRNA A-37 threonylcarbamoyl transferase component Bud32